MSAGNSSERPPLLDNPRAERVRRVRGLAGRSARERNGRILVEGPQAVRELVRHRAPWVLDVYLTAQARERHPEIDEAARSATRWVHEISEGVARAMSGEAQGVVAVADAGAIGGAVPGRGALAARVAGAAPVAGAVPDRGAPGVLAVLAEAQDPGNAGTIIRTADAMGAAGVVVAAGSVDVRAPKVIRSSAGSVFHLPVVTGWPLDEAVRALHEQECVLVGTSGSDGSLDLAELLEDGLVHAPSVLAGPVAWMMGNEARGLSADQEALCDLLVRIPMTGQAESLNVASAAAICLFASQTAGSRARYAGGHAHP